MVAKRDQFQRVYDLTERVHPNRLEEAYSEAEAKIILTARTIKVPGDCVTSMDTGLLSITQIQTRIRPQFIGRVR